MTISLGTITDFYVLEALRLKVKAKYDATYAKKWEKLDEKVNAAIDELVPAMTDMLYTYMFAACIGEARHAQGSYAEWVFSPDLPKSEGREGLYEYSKRLDPVKCLPVLHDLFAKQSWSASKMGGPAWAEIAKGAMMRGTVSDVAFIDHAVDLQHNGGCMFDKTRISNHYPMSLKYPGGVPLQKFLNFKAAMDVIDDDWGFDGTLRVAPKVHRLLESYLGEGNVRYYTYIETDWTWEPFKFGDEVIGTEMKISKCRDVAENDNELSDGELTSIATEALYTQRSGMRLVSKYGSPETKSKMLEYVTEAVQSHVSETWEERYAGGPLDRNVYDSMLKNIVDGMLSELKGGGALQPKYAAKATVEFDDEDDEDDED
jgi:hypothetical protein